MKFYELIKNKKLDNTKASLEDINKKFQEEASEVIEALYNYSTEKSKRNALEVIKELFDVIQMVITILLAVRLREVNYEERLHEAYISHVDKLSDREWTTGRCYEVNIKE